MQKRERKGNILDKSICPECSHGEHFGQMDKIADKFVHNLLNKKYNINNGLHSKWTDGQNSGQIIDMNLDKRTNGQTFPPLEGGNVSRVSTRG